MTTPFRIARGGDIVSLDPMTAEFFTNDVLSNVFEGLVRHDALMALEPALASDWSTADDLTWSFRLRPNVRFHDGTPLTSERVKEAFDRLLLEADAPGRQFLATVDSIRAVSPSELVLHTTSADPLLLQRLAQIRIARGSTTAEVIDLMSGTGPYRLSDWRPGDRTLLEANEDYWGGVPDERHVEFVVLPRGNRLQSLIAGEIDLMGLSTAIATPSGSDIEVLHGPSLTRMFLWFGARNEPSRDERVRRAVSLAIDQTSLAERVVGHPSLAATQLVPASVFGHVAGLPPPDFDPERARDLLKAAKLPEGFEVRLLHSDSPLVAQTATEVVEMLAVIGIRVIPEAVSMERIVSGFEGTADTWLLSYWTYDDGDAGSFLRDCIRTRSPELNRGLLNPGFSDPMIDEWIDQSLSILDNAERLQRYQKVINRTVTQVPILPLFDQPTNYAVRRGVEWKIRADSRVDARTIRRSDGQ